MIDTHVHLNEISESEKAVARAKSAGITRIIAVGMDTESNKQALALAARYPQRIYPAIGYHPCSILPDQIENTLEFIENNLPHCIGIGEIGLDYKVKVKKDLQREVFSRLLALAYTFKLPVIVHSRFSHRRTFQMVRDAGLDKAVFHWYTGPIDLLEEIIKAGYHISATPALVYSPPHQAAIEQAPLERILTETDAPVVYQGKTSEPADLLTTVKEISRIKGVSCEEVKRITTANAEKLFCFLD